MTRYYIAFSLLWLFVAGFYSCQPNPSGSSDADGVLRIDLEPHMKAIDTLRVSDYFSSVEYIPLETRDSCLVGQMPRLLMHKDTILLAFEDPPECLSFDISGRFLRHIGRVGKGPGEYSFVINCLFNDFAGTVFFWKAPNYRMVEYSFSGAFLSDHSFARKEDGYGYTGFLHDGTRLWFYREDVWGSKRRLNYFDQQGNVFRREFRASAADSYDYDKYYSSDRSYIALSSRILDVFGLVAMGQVVIDYTDRLMLCRFFLDLPFSYYRDQTFLRERHNDTIFEVTRDGLIPHLILDLGKYHWPIEHRFEDVAYSGNHTFISWYEENEHFVFFEFYMGKRGNGEYPHKGGTIQPYKGVYDKRSGKVKIAKANDGFIDDVNGFMPLRFLVKTLEGDFVGLLYPLHIRQWFEENPDKAAKLPEHLKRLRNISEEANPVVVVMRQIR